MLDDEERVEPVQGDGVEVEQVAGDDAVGLRPEATRPVLAAPRLTQTPGSPITPSVGNRCSEAVSGDLGRDGYAGALAGGRLELPLAD